MPRRSQADYDLPTGVPLPQYQRPEPPADLEPAVAEVWRSTVSSMRPDHFRRAMYPPADALLPQRGGGGTAGRRATAPHRRRSRFRPLRADVQSAGRGHDGAGALAAHHAEVAARPGGCALARSQAAVGTLIQPANGSRPLLNPAQIVGVEGNRRIITELNGDDVTNVIAEDVNDLADRVRAEWPWLFLRHLIANVKFRCGHRTCSELFKCRRRPNRYINNCWCTLLRKYRDNCPGILAQSQRARRVRKRKERGRDLTRLRQTLAAANDVCGLLDVQALFCRRRHQPRRPALAKIRPGSPAPAMGPGTTVTVPDKPISSN